MMTLTDKLPGKKIQKIEKKIIREKLENQKNILKKKMEKLKKK